MCNIYFLFKQGRKLPYICIKCNKSRGELLERERYSFGILDIIHGLPIIHSKDLDRDREIERKEQGQKLSIRIYVSQGCIKVRRP